MKTLSLFHSLQSSTQDVKETAMKPLNFARRAAGWLFAAGLALGVAGLPVTSAAQDAVQIEKLKKAEELVKQLKPAGKPDPVGGFIFTKTGQQTRLRLCRVQSAFWLSRDRRDLC